jgi:hypothetical protein
MEILTTTVLSLLCLVDIEQNREILNSNGQQFHQYQQNKRKFKQ